MTYGETVDLSQYISTSKKSGVYTLSASPAGVLQASGNSVKAIGTGAATVTAKLSSGNSATLSVSVKYATITGIEIFHTGKLYQDLSGTESVTFTAFLGEGADPSKTVDWYLGGKPVSTAAGGLNYTLPKQSAAGAYTIKAELDSDDAVFAEKIVRVYAPFELPELVYDGGETYDEPTPVSFSFNGEATEGNPEYLFEMYVNGELIEAVHDFSPDFTFTPKSAGVYTFEFKINGKTIDEDAEPLTVRFKGVVNPYGLSLDFDNDYPAVYLRWANREETLFTILIKQGENAKTISNVDVSAGFYNIGDSVNITQNCEIKIKSEDAGEIYLGGDWAVYNHTAVPSVAISYLNKKYLSSNYYMVSDDEVMGVFDYMLIFRPNAATLSDRARSECAVYLGYSSAGSADYYSARFRARLTITGNYWTGTAVQGKILNITLDFFSADSPTNFDTDDKLTHRVLIHPVTSQIGYEGELPVEAFATSSSPVSNSNQLFYTLEQRLKPVFTQGSGVESLYNKAKTVLKGITDNGMSEVETVRAIFDFVMYSASYDDAITGNSSISFAVLQPAYYPEGVLSTGFAVCDGISKTFSLLCNMMGIRCVRIVGTARTSGSSRGADHAWNKVLISGEWYFVDATWGIGKTIIGGVTYKLGSHDYFLLSDADVSQSHTEMNIGYPKTAQVGYNWYIKNNRYFYHTDTAGVAVQVEDFATRIHAIRDNQNFTVMGEDYGAAFSAFEFAAADTIINHFKADSENADFLMRALHRKGVTNFQYLIVGRVVIIAVR